jgi:hypothetical protein
MEFIDSLDTPNRENNLRDDIKSRSNKGFDARDAKVRRQSIGWLDDTYLGSRIILQPRYFRDAYTRIPPLATLSTSFYNHGLRDSISKRAKGLFALLGLGVASVYGWTRATALNAKETAWAHSPKSYQIDRGAFIDWAVIRHRLLRIAAPLILLTFLVTALAIYAGSANFKVKSKGNVFSSNSSSAPGTTKPSYASPNASSSSNSSVKAKATTSPSNDSSYYLGPSSTSTSGSSTASSGSSGSTTGSSSDNSSSSSSSSSSGSSSGSSGSSSLLPATVTVPAINTSLDGKTLVDTSPVTLTLN